jgi:hypothetical protein
MGLGFSHVSRKTLSMPSSGGRPMTDRPKTMRHHHRLAEILRGEVAVVDRAAMTLDSWERYASGRAQPSSSEFMRLADKLHRVSARLNAVVISLAGNTVDGMTKATTSEDRANKIRRAALEALIDHLTASAPLGIRKEQLEDVAKGYMKILAKVQSGRMFSLSDAELLTLIRRIVPDCTLNEMLAVVMPKRRDIVTLMQMIGTRALMK